MNTTKSSSQTTAKGQSKGNSANKEKKSAPSIAKNACGIAKRLFAESSNVRSNHCVEATMAGDDVKDITNFANDEILSERIGLRL